MATVKKIGENVFLISWTANKNPNLGNYPGRQPKEETTAQIAEISQFCQLVFKWDQSYEKSLEVDIRPFPLAAKEVKYQMLKPASVSVITNGVEQAMEFRNSKWTTSLAKACECGYGTSSNYQTKLNIFIEFISTTIKSEIKHVMDHLLNMWETKTLADVTFKFKEKEVKAHTLIIASGSPVLAAMFQNDFKEKQERVVTIKDTKPAVFEKMLRFFYTGSADLDIADAVDLLIVANKYGVDLLREECAFFLAQNLTVNRVIRCLIVSHLHESPYLYKSALEFISQNSESIVTKKDWVDLMKNYHELCLVAVQKMVLSKNKLAPAEKLKK